MRRRIERRRRKYSIDEGHSTCSNMETFNISFPNIFSVIYDFMMVTDYFCIKYYLLHFNNCCLIFISHTYINVIIENCFYWFIKRKMKGIWFRHIFCIVCILNGIGFKIELIKILSLLKERYQSFHYSCKCNNSLV